jgi:hypothetical protein
LNKKEILAAIVRLSELAAGEGVRLEMTVYGETLLRLTKTKTVAEVRKVIGAFFPDTVLADPVELTLAEILANIHEDQSASPPSPAFFPLGLVFASA